METLANEIKSKSGGCVIIGEASEVKSNFVNQ